MPDGESKPCMWMRVPNTLLVCAGVELEQVRYPRRLELSMQALVPGTEARIASAHVEGEERRSETKRTSQLRYERVSARPAVR